MGAPKVVMIHFCKPSLSFYWVCTTHVTDRHAFHLRTADEPEKHRNGLETTILLIQRYSESYKLISTIMIRYQV